MIPQHHLTIWQAYAPWPRASQIEQDLRLSRGVAAIFADPVLGTHLAMRGGTVLHKAHLAPAARYSEDIDLVLVKPMNSDALEQHLRRVLAPVLGTHTRSLVNNVVLAIRNMVRPSGILRSVYRFVPTGLQREETIKVEVNLDENSPLYSLVDVELDTLDSNGNPARASVRSYDINEMLGTKMRALMQRVQGRDLFDLYHAWQLSEADATAYRVDGAQAMKAFAWYLEKEGTRMGFDEANALLNAKLRDAAFRQDMDTLLRPDLPRFNVDEGADVVRRVFFEHLRP